MNQINTQEHFKVPEGYFENFVEQMINNLPEQDFQPMNIAKRQNPWLIRAAASVASFLLVGLSAYTVMNDNNIKTVDTANVEQIQQVQQYSIDAADYAMLDRQDIFGMITE